MPEVILVDYQDRPIGTMEKLEAHRHQKLHRAFSVFLYDGNRLLLQKRASHKYHCGGLWTNTCCSHPAPGESVPDAASRRLQEELGVALPPSALEEVDVFFYRYPFDNGLTEFECDHVLIGQYCGTPDLNPDEVDELAWVSFEQLEQAMVKHAERFTPWFLICAEKAIGKIRTKSRQ